MKNQRPKDINSWKCAGAVMAAAACFLFHPASSQAAPDTIPSVYLGNELGALGDASVATASQTDVKNALKAILGQTENTGTVISGTGPGLTSNPGLIVTYILSSRIGASTANDAAAFAPTLVTTAIQGLQQSVWAGSGGGSDPVTQDAIVSIVSAAANSVAQLAANAGTGTTNALKASGAASKVATALTTMGQNAATTTIPVGSSAANLAAAVFNALAQVTYTPPFSGATATTLPATNLATVAGGIVTKLAPSQQAAAGTTVSSGYLTALNFTAASGSDRNVMVQQLLKDLPVTAVSTAVSQVLAQSGQTYTTVHADASALLKLSVGSVTDIPKGAALVQGILAAGGSTSFASMVADVSPLTSTYVVATRSPILASLAAGASVVNPANAGTYVNQALTAETSGTKASQNATGSNMSDLIVGVATALAGANSATGLQNAVSDFVSQTNPWIANIVKPADRVTLAANILLGTVKSLPDMSSAAGSALAAVVSSVAPLAVGNDSTDLSNLAINLITKVPATGANFSWAVQNIVNTVVNNAAWSPLGGSSVVASNVAGSTSSLSNAAKSQVAAGLALADPSNATANVLAIAGQYTGATSLANRANIVAATLQTSVGAAQATALVQGIITQVDTNPSAAAGTTLDADRKSLATALTKGAIAPNGTASTAVLNAVAQTATYNLASVAGGNGAGLDAVQCAYDVAGAMILVAPLNNTVVDAAVTQLMPSAAGVLGDTVRFAAKAIAASSKSAVEVAKEIGILAQGQGVSLLSLVTTPATGGAATATLAGNAQIPAIAAGFAMTTSDLGSLLPAVLKKSAANGGAIVSAIVVGKSVPQFAAGLTGSAAAIVAGTAGTVPSTIGAIVNPVASAVVSSGTQVIANIIAAVMPDLSDFCAATKALPTRPADSLPLTDSSRSKYNTALNSLNTQELTRVADLGSLVGNAAVGITDQATLDAMILATTGGSVTVPQVTGTTSGVQQTVSLSGLLQSATTYVAATTTAGQNAYGITNALTSYAVKGETAITAGKGAPFVQAFLTTESSVFSLSSVSALSNLVGGVINSVTAKASDIAQGAAAFAMAAGSPVTTTISAFATSLSGTVAILAKANAAAGLATYSLANGGNGSSLSDITGAFASSCVTAGGSAIDANIIGVAVAVAKVKPVYAWNVAMAAAAQIQGKTASQDNLSLLANKMVTAIATSLTGPTVTERLGLLAAAIATGANITDPQEIAKIIAGAIKAKAAAAYDIFGSVVRATGAVASSVQADMNWAFGQVSYVPPTSGIVGSQIQQAVTDLANATGHFYNPTTGDLTGTETAVTNM